jgi:phosphate transport system ATP-binding protein
LADAPAIRTVGLNLWYGSFQALHDVTLDIPAGVVTSMIGPSGCGKSTLLRAVNRIVERLDYVRVAGRIEVLGHDVYGPSVALVQVRKKIGMVFQRPNPLPLSIRDNVLYGHRLHHGRGTRKTEDAIVEETLRAVLLWEDVKDRLNTPALRLPLDAQQKLCIARLLPVKPAVLLMDEPCSALDPDGTAAVEELIHQLRGQYTMVVVTHNMAQARRVSDRCVFMLMGRVEEQGSTEQMFVTPTKDTTADYVEGRLG